MKTTTERELKALYSSDAYTAMDKTKGRKQENRNWQTAEAEAAKRIERMSRSVNVGTCPGSSQNGIEVLDSSFSETHSANNGYAPMEVRLMNTEKQRPTPFNVKSEDHRHLRRTNSVRDERPILLVDGEAN